MLLLKILFDIFLLNMPSVYILLLFHILYFPVLLCLISHPSQMSLCVLYKVASWLCFNLLLPWTSVNHQQPILPAVSISLTAHCNTFPSAGPLSLLPSSQSICPYSPVLFLNFLFLAHFDFNCIIKAKKKNPYALLISTFWIFESSVN